MEFSTKDFFSKCDQIRRKLFVWCLIFKTSCQPFNEQIGCKHPFGALELVITGLHSLDLIIPFFSLQSPNPDGKYFAQFVCTTKCVRIFIRKCDSFVKKHGHYYEMYRFYYKMRQFLQNAIFIIKCVGTRLN